jgi:hypothetical protein
MRGSHAAAGGGGKGDSASGWCWAHRRRIRGAEGTLGIRGVVFCC